MPQKAKTTPKDDIEKLKETNAQLMEELKKVVNDRNRLAKLIEYIRAITT